MRVSLKVKLIPYSHLSCNFIHIAPYICVCVVCFYDYTLHTFCNYFQFPTKQIRVSVFACVSILHIFFKQAKQGQNLELQFESKYFAFLVEMEV